MSGQTTMPQQQTTALAPVEIDPAVLEAVLVSGDISRLTPPQRLAYYRMRCDAAGLDPRAQPFQFLQLQGKLVLYATKACTQQLAGKNGVSLAITSQVTEGDLRVVTVRAAAKDGRATEEIGCVSVAGLRGEALANAYMKAVTKAKRRAVLALCGLGEMDESEVESVPGARVVPVDLEAEPARPAPIAKPAPAAVTAAAPRATIDENIVASLMSAAGAAGWTPKRLISRGAEIAHPAPIHSLSDLTEPEALHLIGELDAATPPRRTAEPLPMAPGRAPADHSLIDAMKDAARAAGVRMLPELRAEIVRISGRADAALSNLSHDEANAIRLAFRERLKATASAGTT